MGEADDMPPAIVNVKKRPTKMEDFGEKFDLLPEAATESAYFPPERAPGVSLCPGNRIPRNRTKKASKL
jgi:hypothetical protein